MIYFHFLLNIMFEPSYGNLTKKVRKIYLNYLIKTKKIKKVTKNMLSLKASSDKLYFWQLYSILGEDIITDIITRFYTRIFNDTINIGFSNVFKESGSIEYHIMGQKRFWLDAMGGGKYYRNGKKKVYQHHVMVKNIMTYEGSILWLYHMYSVLDTYTELHKDIRVVPCIKEFLLFFMKKYSKQFKFNSKL